MPRLGHARFGAALLGAVALAGCGGSHGQAMRGTITDTASQAVSRRFHSATHHYSIRQVKQAFAANGVELHNVLPKDYRGLLALLAEPSHAVYVYVIQDGCKCTLLPPIRDGRKTRHGNLDVLWLRRETPAVQAALRALD